MSDAMKKPKSSPLLYLLLAVIVLVLLCAAIMVYIVAGRHSIGLSKFSNSTSSPLISSSGSSVPSTSTIIVPTVTTTQNVVPSRKLWIRSTTTSTTTVGESESDASNETLVTTNYSLSTTTIASNAIILAEITRHPDRVETTGNAFTNRPTSATLTDNDVDTFSLIDEITKVIDVCASIPAERISCPKTNDDAAVVPSFMLSPLHYCLNITIKTVAPTVLNGDMKMFIQMNERGKQISLSVDSELVNIEHIYVVNCDTGLTLCVTKTVFDQREQLLSLILLETVEAGTNLRVDVVKFSSVDNMKVTYVQTALRWDKNTPLMFGTLLTNGTARKIFPVLDNMTFKATLDLCVMFTPTTRMRSNSAIKFVATDGLTCFERTVPLAVQQIAFVGFENAETLIYNTTTLNGTYIPDIEIVFSINKNFKREKHEWIYRESCKVMTLMTTWTRFPYPLKELKFISAPIRAPSHSSLGLITLQDRLVDHPSYTLAHVSLIHSVIQQWLPGLVGSTKSNESCFMESLSVYLEWKVDEVLHIVNKTRGTEVELIRPQDLSSEEKDSLRPVRVVESITSCSKRLTAIFYTIDETFGQNTMTNVIEYIFHNFAYASTTIADWQRAVAIVTKSDHAGLMLSQWFSRESRPVLLLTVTSHAITVEQETKDLWAVPIEVVGSTGTQMFIVTSKSTVLPFSSNDYVIADPQRKSTAMIIYDADSYLRLIRCWEDSRCPVKQDTLRGIIRDLGAVLLDDKLRPPRSTDILKWKALFKFTREHHILTGNASCCTEYAISRRTEISCTWIVRDVCEKIRFINSVAG